MFKLIYPFSNLFILLNKLAAWVLIWLYCDFIHIEADINWNNLKVSYKAVMQQKPVWSFVYSCFQATEQFI